MTYFEGILRSRANKLTENTVSGFIHTMEFAEEIKDSISFRNESGSNYELIIIKQKEISNGN